MANYNFKVDLKGIIRLLSDNLYSSDKVFLRELLQNAVDAIGARKRADASCPEGKVTVTYRKNTKGAKLVFEDNGIGLTKEEIHSFLSVIGQSSKRQDTVRNSFIGQFGIGLLSCFLVTGEIKVLTRSATEEKTYQWVGKSDGSYVITEPKKQMEPGTQVHLQLAGSKYDFFKEQEIIDNLAEYAFLLRTPVFFDGESVQKIVNSNFIPWRQQISMAEDMMAFGEQVFEEQFFDVIPLTGDGMKGYAFVSAIPASASRTTARHKIFLKDMYVSDDGRDLIPQWAFFTRCIINMDDLTPTASREGFTRDGKLLRAKNQIEKSIFDYFVALSQYDVRKLKLLTQIHNVAIKSLAMENEQIYKLFFPFLTFPTNQGSMTGFQIVNAAKKVPVSYCVELDDFRRISPLLEGTKSLLINGGYIYDAGLLQRLTKFYKNVRIQAFDNGSYEHILEDAPEELSLKLAPFLNWARQGLEAFRCSVQFKSFSPNSLQALYVPGEDTALTDVMDESSYSGFFEGFDFGAEEAQEGNRLYLNSGNGFIQSLGQVRDPKLAQTLIHVIYIQAMLAGHYTLSAKETELMNQCLRSLMEYALHGEK